MSTECRPGGLLSRLRRARHGSSATIFALAMPVLVGGLALGIDAGMVRMVHNRMQGAVDAAALRAAMEIERGGNVGATAIAYLDQELPAEFAGMTTAADITLGTYTAAGGFQPGGGASVNAVRIRGERSEARGNAVNRFFAQFWNASAMTIAVEAIAARPVNVFYQPPESDTLDPNAGDFNEIYAYCYDTQGVGSPASRRSQMTLVANNMPSGQNIVQISGGVITQNQPPRPMTNWPVCNQAGQTLSIRLRNVRHAKSNPVLWANPNATISNRRPGRPEHNYYSDTTISNGVETFDLQGFNILETVRCDTVSQCTPGTIGSQIPSGTNRANTRQRAAQPCEPGKFMYFGFEDRPPGQPGANASWLDPAWTDSDYDDIRIVMRCPASGRLGDAFVRLVS